MGILSKKSVSQALSQREEKRSGFVPTLGVWDLTALGVGAIIGTGIFVLTGLAAANYAGPGVILSFILAGVVSMLAALIYTELSTALPVTGSAYTFSYVSLGELVAWIAGWCLILGYLVASGAVAIGWSSYIVDLLQALGIALPHTFTRSPFEGGIINVPAALIVLAMTALVIRGTQHSAVANKIVVTAKLAAIALLLIIGVRHFNLANWNPFLPFGLSGVVKGSSIVFFAYIGFDVIATASEETKNPQRDLPRGIIYSLVISTILYIGVSIVLTGMVKYTELNTASPVATALLRAGVSWASALVSVGALAGLTSVLLVNMYGMSRVLFSMGRDDLLPPIFDWIHPRYRTPLWDSLLIGLFVAVISALLPIGLLAELANAGILSAFIVAALALMVLRTKYPDLKRPFKVPFMPAVPVLTIISAGYLIANLSSQTLVRFMVWLLIGLVIYFAYGHRKSIMAQREHPAGRISLEAIPAPARKPDRKRP